MCYIVYATVEQVFLVIKESAADFSIKLFCEYSLELPVEVDSIK